MIKKEKCELHGRDLTKVCIKCIDIAFIEFEKKRKFERQEEQIKKEWDERHPNGSCCSNEWCRCKQ